MANMHVLTAANGVYRVVAHIPVPTGNNSAGIAWRTAIVASGIGGRTVLPAGDGTGGTISSAESTAITSTGSVYEDVADVDATLRGVLTTAPQLAAFLDAWYTARSAELTAQFQAQLKWWGQTR